MERVIGARGEHGVDGDQILDLADLGGEDDLGARQAEGFGIGGGEQRRLHDRLAHHLLRGGGLGKFRVLVHEAREQRLIERAPVDADAHRLVVAERQLDEGRELGVALLPEADVAGIDAVFVERLGRGGMLRQQRVAVVVEIADERHGEAAGAKAVADVRHGRRRLVAIDGDAHDLRAGAGERRDLRDGAGDIGGVGVGHRLHHHRRAAADHDVADHHGHGGPARERGGGEDLILPLGRRDGGGPPSLHLRFPSGGGAWA